MVTTFTIIVIRRAAKPALAYTSFSKNHEKLYFIIRFRLKELITIESFSYALDWRFT